MTKEELYNKISQMQVYRVHGKDCSEYAEDVKDFLGEGTIITFERQDSKFFRTQEFEAISEPFKYHTVLLVDAEGEKLIVDLTNERLVIVFDDFINELKGINQNAVFICRGTGLHESVKGLDFFR